MITLVNNDHAILNDLSDFFWVPYSPNPFFVFLTRGKWILKGASGIFDGFCMFLMFIIETMTEKRRDEHDCDIAGDCNQRPSDQDQDDGSYQTCGFHVLLCQDMPFGPLLNSSAIRVILPGMIVTAVPHTVCPQGVLTIVVAVHRGS